LDFVKSKEEAEVLRDLYNKIVPDDVTIPPPPPQPTNKTVHIGFHDQFIENEYLTVRSK
jgi:hypothetical protein